MTGELRRDWLVCKSHDALPLGIRTPGETQKGKTIQEVLKMITRQRAPPFSPEPTVYTQVFINIVSFNPLIPDLGRLLQTQLFPRRLLVREENRCSTTDTAFNKPKKLILCVYLAFITCSNFSEPLNSCH